MKNKYAIQGNNVEHSAKVKGKDLQISTKHCIEISNYIRKKEIKKAKELLKLAIEKKKAVPFKKFNKDAGHKKGRIAGGKYPVKACTEVLKLLNSVEANAQFKGLNTSNLIINHICVNKGSGSWRYGRHIRRKGKRTNIEIVVEEAKQVKKIQPKKQEVKKEVPKELVKEKPVEKEKVGLSKSKSAPPPVGIRTKPEVKK